MSWEKESSHVSFRLLAYGGTVFAERRRIGIWSLPESTLSDFYGLTAGDESFGIGRTGEGRPTLVYRQRQHLENRGGYPFTLLFDPGEDLWLRFGWNAAALVVALKADGTGAALFTSPDEVEQDAIADMIVRLAPASDWRGSSAPPSALAEMIAGSMVAGAAVAASHASVAFEERPTTVEVATALHATGDTMPAFCRTGLGWLVGGSLAHVDPFGLRLVLDDQLPSHPDALRDARDAGRRIIDRWQQVRLVYPDALRALHALPPWRWPMPVPELLRRVALVATLLDEEIDDETYAAVRDVESEGGVLAGEILSLASTRADVPRALGRNHALFMLDRCWRGARVSPDFVHAVDRDWLYDEILRRGSPPGELPSALPLDLTSRAELWVRFLSRTASRDRMAWLPAAAAQLDGLDDFRAIVDAAVPEDPMPAQFEQLRAIPKGRITGAIARRVRRALRSRVRRGRVDARAYVRHVADLDEYYNDIADLPDVRTITVEFIAKLLDDAERDADGEDWLQALAGSRARTLVPLHLKRQIAEHVGSPDTGAGAWAPFLALCALCEGGDVPTPTVADVERAALRTELDELSYSRTACPDIVALEHWLGPLPNDTLDRLRIAVGRRIAERDERDAAWPSTRTPASAAPNDSDQHALDLAVKDAVFRSADLADLRAFVEGALCRDDMRRALTTVVQSVEAQEGRRLAASLTDRRLAMLFVAASSDAGFTVPEWFAHTNLLAAHFGQTISAMLRGDVPTDPVEARATWSVVDFLRARPAVLERLAITLRGKHNWSAFAHGVGQLTPEVR